MSDQPKHFEENKEKEERIIDEVLFSLGSWVGGFLYFLGIHMISFVIATILLWNGNVNGNKATLYKAVGFYVFSFIAAGDPSRVINHIPPFVVGVLVLIGTLLLKNEE